MNVVALWRYPVKSLSGERLEELELDRRGVVADRRLALVDPEGGIASGKTTRRFRRVRGLLLHAASLDGGEPVLRLADGRRVAPSDEVAEELAGPGWRFAVEGATSHFDMGSVHLVTTATLRSLAAAAGHAVEPERLRPNVLVDGGEAREEEWLGRRVRIGDVELEVTERAPRCVMVGPEQHGGLVRRRRLLKTIAAWNDLDAGVYADVLRPGWIRVGDAVAVVP